MLGKYFIAVLPDKQIIDAVEQIRAQHPDIIPPLTPVHLTLRESFYTSNVDGLINSLENALAKQRGFNARLDGYTIFQKSQNHLVFKVKKNPSLQAVHEIAMEVAKDFIDQPKQYSTDGMPDEEKMLLEKYKMPYCFQYYNPHITIGTVSDPSKFTKLGTFDHEFYVDTVVIVDKNSNSVFHRIDLKA